MQVKKDVVNSDGTIVYKPSSSKNEQQCDLALSSAVN